MNSSRSFKGYLVLLLLPFILKVKADTKENILSEVLHFRNLGALEKSRNRLNDLLVFNEKSIVTAQKIHTYASNQALRGDYRLAFKNFNIALDILDPNPLTQHFIDRIAQDQKDLLGQQSAIFLNLETGKLSSKNEIPIGDGTEKQAIEAEVSKSKTLELDTSSQISSSFFLAQLPILHKLNRIKASIDFAGTPLSEALDTLGTLSKQLDHTETGSLGIKFILFDPDGLNPRIDSTFGNYPLSRILDSIATGTGFEYDIKNESIVFRPKNMVPNENDSTSGASIPELEKFYQLARNSKNKKIRYTNMVKYIELMNQNSTVSEKQIPLLIINACNTIPESEKSRSYFKLLYLYKFLNNELVKSKLGHIKEMKLDFKSYLSTFLGVVSEYQTHDKSVRTTRHAKTPFTVEVINISISIENGKRNYEFEWKDQFRGDTFTEIVANDLIRQMIADLDETDRIEILKGDLDIEYKVLMLDYLSDNALNEFRKSQKSLVLNEAIQNLVLERIELEDILAVGSDNLSEFKYSNDFSTSQLGNLIIDMDRTESEDTFFWVIEDIFKWLDLNDLLRIALYAKDHRYRYIATERIAESEINNKYYLSEIALKTTVEQIALLAIDEHLDSSVLEELSQYSKFKKVRKAANREIRFREKHFK